MLKDFRTITLYLDRSGDARVHPHSKVIQSERQFLLALGAIGPEDNLHIVGEELCRWATAIGRMRRANVVNLVSLAAQIADTYGVSLTSARQISARFEHLDLGKVDQLSLPVILNAVTDDYQDLWDGSLTVQHAAKWLQWWALDQDEAVRELVAVLGRTLSNSSDEPLVQRVYSVQSQDQAIDLLAEWTGITHRGFDFPVWVQNWWIQSARPIRRTLTSIIQDRFARANIEEASRTVSRIRDNSIRADGAGILAKKIRNANSRVSLAQLKVLRDALPTNSQLLRGLKVELADLPDPPRDLNQMVTWYASFYREWLDAQVTTEVVSDLYKAIGQRFSHTYLEEFPRALAAGSTESRRIAWKKSAEVLARAANDDDRTTIVLVLDGVGPLDLDDFLRKLRSRIDASVVQSDFVICAPPTITRFAKPSIVTGKPHDERVTHVPDVVGHNKFHEVARLAKTQNVITWTVTEPDTTYHQQAVDAPMERVRTFVDVAMQEVVELVARALDEVHTLRAYRLIVTSDHGRLMFPSDRIDQQPPGLETHGRAAWHRDYIAREMNREFEIDGSVAWLNPASYGIRGISSLAVRVDDAAFTYSDGRTGFEVFPHGGVFPEEVIVPWVELQSGRLEMRIGLMLVGDGVAGQPSEAELTVTNKGDLQALVENVTVGEETVPVNHSVGPREQSTIRIPLLSWPESEDVHVEAFVRAPNGDVKITVAETGITVSKLQSRDEFDIF